MINENLPIYIQIAEGIKDHILSKEVKEETLLPSTTFISKNYGVNIATVNKAFNTLVDEGLAYKKRGIGIFVIKGAVDKLIKERRKVFKEKYIKSALIEARRLNYSIEELQKLVKEEFDDIKQ